MFKKIGDAYPIKAVIVSDVDDDSTMEAYKKAIINAKEKEQNLEDSKEKNKSE